MVIIAHARYPCHTRDHRKDSPSLTRELALPTALSGLMDFDLKICVPNDCPIKKSK